MHNSLSSLCKSAINIITLSLQGCYGSSCYRFESNDEDKKTYGAASADCAGDGAYLVCINDEDENDWITSIA